LGTSSRVVGGLNITALKPMSAGKVRVEVTFELDEMGTLQVTARDLFSGRTYASSFELGEARQRG
jgi:molecular chaperone DnaK (HSP70)